MTPIPELKSAQNLTSADYLAARVKEAYQSLGTEHLSDIESLYASDIYFEDPLHAVQGRAALMQYFTKQFANLEKCAFKFHSTIVNDTDVFMTWTMFLNHPKLRGGETVRVEGSSYLRTRNGKVYYHRDYFDLGSMLYENVPLLGHIIRKLKSRVGQ